MEQLSRLFKNLHAGQRHEDNLILSAETEDSKSWKQVLQQFKIGLRHCIGFDESQRYDSLAHKHWEHFRESGEREELEKSIDHSRTALGLQPEGHPHRRATLHRLVWSISMRYTRWGQLEDLEEAIDLIRADLELHPEGHPNRSLLLSKLAWSLTTRYRMHGSAEDLKEAIDLNRTVLELRPEGHPKRSATLTYLARSLEEQYYQQEKAEDLEKAIELYRAALELRPEGHPNRSGSLNDIANCLRARYARQGDTKDIEDAIELNRAALGFCSEGHPNYPSSLNHLANSLRGRYMQQGRVEDLDKAIECYRASLVLRSEDHTNRSIPLLNLAVSLGMRYRQNGNTEDLEDVIELHRAVLELLPEGHLDKFISLTNLANSLWYRFNQQGRTEDLEDAIKLHRATFELSPNSHHNRTITCNNLAISLRTRYKQQGRIKDLEEVVELHQAALDLLPESHPDRSVCLTNLAISLNWQYYQWGKTEDLEGAIKLHRAALELVPESQNYRYIPLTNLANCLRSRYAWQRRTKDLEDAIELHRAAVMLLPEGHPEYSSLLIRLASSLATRYEQQGRTENIEEAIGLGRAALELRPEGHPDRSISLNCLADHIYAWIEGQQLQMEDVEGYVQLLDDFKECIRLLELAASHEFSGSRDRLNAAQRWVTLARLHKHDTTFAAYKTTILTLQRALTIDPTLHAQHDFLLSNSNHGILSLDAASYAVENNQLEQAIETLEQGRGLLWSQLRGLRTPLDQLAESNEELVASFRDVSRRLENLALSHETLMSSSIADRDGSVSLDPQAGRKSFDDALKLKRQLVNEQEAIINEIRCIPGFENFLEATPFKILQQAALEGPVIVVNHCKYRCDALIIFSCGDSPIACIPLDKDFYKDSNELCNELLETRQHLTASSSEYDEKLREAMRVLWDRVVSKVVVKLKEHGIVEGSRIWWCPTSVLSMLPFHAAGPFEDADGAPKYLLDDYVSSYTPTLGALINARVGSVEEEPKVLIVGDLRDSSKLRAPKQEIRNIRNCGMSTKLLSKKPNACPSRSTVIKALQESTWVHFTCHGSLDSKPFCSSFNLSDGDLTMLDIIRASSPNAEFAFLSACHTAEQPHDGAYDETLHLGAAMQFSGFRSVIGSMWELLDEDGPALAKAFYEYINDCEDDEVKYKRAAGGLRKAALELKARDGIQAERWVNLVHIGA